MLFNRVRELRRNRRLSRRLQQFDDAARQTILQTHNFTMISHPRLFSLIEAVRYVSRWSIPGAIVECGVWRGGAIMAAALTLLQLGVRDRRLFLYDTFSGMTRPNPHEYSLSDRKHALEFFQAHQTGPDQSALCQASIDEVRQNLSTTGYPKRHYVLVPGKVEDTIPGTVPDVISILRLDSDWYESTRHELEHLFPLLAPGGVLIVDDYYKWSGCKQAVDEYLSHICSPFFAVKVGNSIIGTKS